MSTATIINDNVRTFENLADVTPDAVEWLKAGSEKRGYAIYNPRSIIYRTKRGVAKSMTCYVRSNGEIKWRSWTSRNVHEGLTTEEARVFAPEIAKSRDERAARYRAEKPATGRRVKVGDVFAGSYGYDATLWRYFEVVRVSESGATCWTRELSHRTASGYGCNDWKCRPAVGSYNGDAERHRVQYARWYKDAEGNPLPMISINSYMNAYLRENVTEWDEADNYH